MFGIRSIVLGFWLLTLPACSQNSPVGAGSSVAYTQLLRTLYRGTVPTITPTELAGQLRNNPASVVMLDTRTPAEFHVSHLDGAQFVNFDSFQPADLRKVPRNRTVVVYCSVGYRSERVGEQLKALGFKDVRNLYGGIFEWVNEGQPVYNQQGRTDNVHPYSALWSPWLRRGNKVYK